MSEQALDAARFPVHMLSDLLDNGIGLIQVGHP